MIQDLSRSTNNNIEHQSLDYLRYTLRPWLVRIEQEFNRKLLTGDFHCQHDMNDFQRGDFASQTAGLQALFNMGTNSINDNRRALHMNPIPAEEGGDLRVIPLNMMTLKQAMNPPEKDPDEKIDAGADPQPGETPPADVMRERVFNGLPPAISRCSWACGQSIWEARCKVRISRLSANHRVDGANNLLGEDAWEVE